MTNISCPGCGAQLILQSPATLFVVCSYCKSTLIRDQDWTVYGKMANLPAEITPLQIGTQGSFKGEGFELIGRQRLQWANGYWTEWCANFPKGKTAWLAEAQGLLMISFPTPFPEEAKQWGELKAGAYLKMGNTTFMIDDVKTARCIGSEGELPFTALPNKEITSIDASNPAGSFLSLEIVTATGERRAYVGEYVEFKDLHLKNLRKLDGW